MVFKYHRIIIKLSYTNFIFYPYKKGHYPFKVNSILIKISLLKVLYLWNNGVLYNVAYNYVFLTYYTILILYRIRTIFISDKLVV
jgi:hypothetical protein